MWAAGGGARPLSLSSLSLRSRVSSLSLCGAECLGEQRVRERGAKSRLRLTTGIGVDARAAFRYDLILSLCLSRLCRLPRKCRGYKTYGPFSGLGPRRADAAITVPTPRDGKMFVSHQATRSPLS